MVLHNVTWTVEIGAVAQVNAIIFYLLLKKRMNHTIMSR